MLGALRVAEFDRYIKHNSLPIKGKKQTCRYIRSSAHAIALHLSAAHTWVRHIQEKDEEKIEEDMVLAEVDSGNDSTDIDLDSEKTDNGRFHYRDG